MYIGDSLGGRTYIDRSNYRPCSSSCHCWDLDNRLDDDFVFTVSKTTSSMEVNIKSVVLYSYLAHLLGQHQDSASQRINAFVLLSNVKFLQTQLNDLRERMHIDPPQGPLMSLLSEQNAQIEAELTLLLEGLITDHQVFRSFGYENLFEQGYLSYDLWKAFQSSSASLIIDRLDNAFHAMSGDEDVVRLDQRARDGFHNDVLDPHTLSMQSPLNLSQAARSGDVVRVKDLLADGCDPNALVRDALNPLWRSCDTLPLVEAIKHNHQEIIDLLISHGANVDGPSDDTSLSPLKAALEGENTYAISKLLSHMADLKILGQVQDEDCWWFATQLIMNHDVSTESILRVLPRSEAMEKRLRCSLFDAGADIKLSTHNNHPSHEARSVRRPAILGGHLDKGTGVVTGNHPVSHTMTEASQNFADLLGLASNVGEGLMTGIDDDKTEAPQSVDNERAMVRAIQRKDMESVNLHIKFGADPSLGLTAALLIHDPRIFKLLLKRGADTDCIVPSKARASLMAAIEAGDRNFVDLLLKACRASESLGDLNFVHDGWTPLMIAVRHNNEYIARRLIRSGATPNFTTKNGDSLTIARQNGFHNVLQILLEGTRVSHPLSESRVCGDDVSSQTLQITNWKERIKRNEQWLNAVVEEQRDSAVPRMDNIRLSNLRLEFRKQHTNILACAKASVKPPISRHRIRCVPRSRSQYDTPRVVTFIRHWTYDNDVACELNAWPCINRRPWGRGFDDDYSKAWTSGINVMRYLHAGKVPSSLNDTIMFLAIAKAMCLSGSAPTLSTWHSDFTSDVGRWQMLFSSEDGSLLAFQEAVSSIWGIQLEQLSHVNSPDSETLASFQELAVTLANDAELSFGLQGHDYGLIASQKLWRSRNKLRVPDEDQHDLVRQESWAFIHQIQASRQLEEKPTRRSPENHTMQDSGNSMPIWNMFRSDPKVHTFNLTATVLMAGFIFSVVLTFLLGKKCH